MRSSNRLFKHLDSILGLCLAPLALFQRPATGKRAGEFPPEKILAVKLCCLGDSLLSLIMLRALKERHPGARITVLASRRSAEVFERALSVDEVITLPIAGLRGGREFFAVFRLAGLFRRLAQRNFDTLLDLDVYYRFTTLLGLAAGRGFSAGFETVPGRARFYGHRVQRPRDAQEWRLFFELAAPLGVSAELPRMPEFRIAVSEKEQADAMLHQMSGKGFLVGIALGSSPNWPEKMWPIAHFAKLMELLAREFGASFFLYGTRPELTLSAELLKVYKGPVTDLTGRTPFALLYETVRRMSLFIANDTGTMHLAALAGVPTVGIFGPTSEKKWAPPGRFKPVFSLACPERPCYYLSRMPECGRRQCLAGLSAETVFKAVQDLLEGTRK